MITVEHLSKRYAGESILRDVCFEVNTGETVALIGASGSGKSTLLRCLNLLTRPDGGRIAINGCDLLAPQADLLQLRRRIGMVPQAGLLFSNLMAVENLMVGPVELLRWPRRRAFDQAMRLLESVKLREKAYAYPDELSGGQAQRIAIARALSMGPDVLLLDEPTSALDPVMVSEVLAVIRKLATEQVTMLIVTHEMRFAAEVADRVLFLHEGAIVESGPPEQLFQAPREAATRRFLRNVHSFHFAIGAESFDLYALNAGVEEFGRRHFLADGQVRSLQLALEELLCGFLLKIPERKEVNITVEHSLAAERTEITLDYPADGCFNPLAPEFASEENELSLLLLQPLFRATRHHYRDGLNILRLTMR